MRRPVGVILSCSLLGVAAALESMLAALMVFAAVVSGGDLKQPSPHQPGALIASAVALLLVAAWSAVTAGALLRLLPWARISILILAGLIVAFSLFGAILAHRHAHTPAPVDAFSEPASTMQNPLLIEALLWTFFDLIAGCWLVYFNLTSTKSYFLPECRYSGHQQPHPKQPQFTK